MNTIKDYIEWADVYPISQERFMMEKTFMEMDLINLHLEAYDQILEHNMTVNQLDMLMVEAGPNGRSDDVEALYMEKVGGIVGGIQKICRAIGKAIAAFFRKVHTLFVGKKKDSEKTTEEAKDLNAQLQEGLQAVKSGENAEQIQGAMQQGAEILGQLAERGADMAARADAMLGGGGCKVVPNINSDNPLMVLNKTVIEQAGSKVNEKILTSQLTLCQNEYEVEGLAIIAEIENLVEMLNELLDIKGGDELATDVVWNSYVKLMTKFGPTGAYERYQNMTDRIVALSDSRQTKKFTMSDEALAKKREAAEKLNTLMGAIANLADIGPEGHATFMDIGDAKIQKNIPQANKREMNMHDFDTRYRRDKELFANRNIVARPGAKFLNKGNYAVEYSKFLRYIYNLAVAIQQATNAVIKALTEHMNARNAAIARQRQLVEALKSGVPQSGNPDAA